MARTERQREREREESQTEGLKVGRVGCFRRSSAAKIVCWRGSAAFANVAASLTEKSSSRLTRYRDTFVSLLLFFFFPSSFHALSFRLRFGNCLIETGDCEGIRGECEKIKYRR